MAKYFLLYMQCFIDDSSFDKKVLELISKMDLEDVTMIPKLAKQRLLSSNGNIGKIVKARLLIAFKDYESSEIEDVYKIPREILACVSDSQFWKRVSFLLGFRPLKEPIINDDDELTLALEDRASVKIPEFDHFRIEKDGIVTKIPKSFPERFVLDVVNQELEMDSTVLNSLIHLHVYKRIGNLSNAQFLQFVVVILKYDFAEVEFLRK
jgi:hypothetical protein